MRGFQVLCFVASLAAVCFARIAPAIDAGEIVNPGLVAKPQTVEININELLAEEALKYPGAIASPKARSEGRLISRYFYISCENIFSVLF